MATVVSLEAIRAERATRNVKERTQRIALGLAELASAYARVLNGGPAAAAGIDGAVLLETMREAVAVLAEHR